MGTISCPRCGGKAVGKRGCLTWLFVILLFPIGLILLLLKVTYRCEACGYRFKEQARSATPIASWPQLGN